MDETQQLPPDSGLCETVCRESGWLGELLVIALFALRAAYVQRMRRVAETQRDSLQEKVRELSLRPPAVPGTIAGGTVTLQLAPNPGAHELLGAALSTRPADPQKQGESGVSTAGDSPEPSDPDWLAPPRDES